MFRLDPFPQWTWPFEQGSLTKQVFLVKNYPAVVVVYSVNGESSLRVPPFLACRDYHGLTHKNDQLNRKVDQHPDRLTLRPYQSRPEIALLHNASQFNEDGLRYYNFEYLVERERMDYLEDLYTPGELVYHLNDDK